MRLRCIVDCLGYGGKCHGWQETDPREVRRDLARLVQTFSVWSWAVFEIPKYSTTLETNVLMIITTNLKAWLHWNPLANVFCRAPSKGTSSIDWETMLRIKVEGGRVYNQYGINTCLKSAWDLFHKDGFYWLKNSLSGVEESVWRPVPQSSKGSPC